MGNQYLMENSLIVLAILFAMNSVNLFSILFGNALSGSIKHFVRNESTDELQEPFSPSEIFFFPNYLFFVCFSIRELSIKVIKR